MDAGRVERRRHEGGEQDPHAPPVDDAERARLPGKQRRREAERGEEGGGREQHPNLAGAPVGETRQRLHGEREGGRVQERELLVREAERVPAGRERRAVVGRQMVARLGAGQIVGGEVGAGRQPPDLHPGRGNEELEAGGDEDEEAQPAQPAGGPGLAGRGRVARRTRGRSPGDRSRRRLPRRRRTARQAVEDARSRRPLARPSS